MLNQALRALALGGLLLASPIATAATAQSTAQTERATVAVYEEDLAFAEALKRFAQHSRDQKIFLERLTGLRARSETPDVQRSKLAKQGLLRSTSRPEQRQSSFGQYDRRRGIHPHGIETETPDPESPGPAMLVRPVRSKALGRQPLSISSRKATTTKTRPRSATALSKCLHNNRAGSAPFARVKVQLLGG